MENKITYVSVLEKVIGGVALTTEEMEKVKALKASIEKKNSAERGETKTQLENNRIKAYIVANIGDKKLTITELIKAIFVNSEWTDMSVSKATALCRQLVTAGQLKQVDEKRKSYYSKA